MASRRNSIFHAEGQPILPGQSVEQDFKAVHDHDTSPEIAGRPSMNEEPDACVSNEYGRPEVCMTGTMPGDFAG
jgi:hypothetical protein